MKTKDEPALTDKLCDAIDQWHAGHPDLTINQIFDAMREIHKALTQAAEAPPHNVIQMRDYSK